MTGKATYREYYAQFAPVFMGSIKAHFTKEGLREKLAQDRNLNNVSLAFWDRMSEAHKSEVARVNKEIGNDSVYSLCDGVCGAKEAAIQYAETPLKPSGRMIHCGETED